MKTAALSSYHGFGKLFKESTKCLVIIVIVVVVFGNEKLVFFQERGHFLADLGTDAQTSEHRQKNLKKESEQDFEAKSGKKKLLDASRLAGNGRILSLEALATTLESFQRASCKETRCRKSYTKIWHVMGS